MPTLDERIAYWVSLRLGGAMPPVEHSGWWTLSSIDGPERLFWAVPGVPTSPTKAEIYAADDATVAAWVLLWRADAAWNRDDRLFRFLKVFLPELVVAAKPALTLEQAQALVKTRWDATP